MKARARKQQTLNRKSSFKFSQKGSFERLKIKSHANIFI